MAARITTRAVLTLPALVVVYVALQWVWLQARDTPLERVLIHELTVGSAVAAINGLTPEARARGVESSIRAAGGGINIRNGCEGTEIWFLLVAAIAVFPADWRHKLLGVLAGAVVVFVLNQARVLGLFYGLRHDRSLFDLLHTFVAPLCMVAGALLFFLTWVAWSGRRAAQAAR
jgi:exosortase family protein XrtM